MKRKEIFNVQTVKLESSNLIEASAGTGKTFSIAILVLRLIVEKNLDIKQILMVTFTKAAVAELEGRVREFIREAYRYSQNPLHKTDTLIQAIVDNGIKISNKTIVIDRLKGASLFLDETSIFTIHSFCQKTLSEFAFETHQLFGTELLDNQTVIIEKATNKYWRKYISTLSVEKLELLHSIGLSKTGLTEVVSKALRGKKFIYKNNLAFDEYFEKTFVKAELVKNLQKEFVDYFQNSEERKPLHIEKSGKYAKNAFFKLSNKPEAFLEMLIKKREANYVSKAFPHLLEKALNYTNSQEELTENLQHLLYYLYGTAIKIVEEQIAKTKHRLSLMVFDDLIVNLHKAVKGEQEDLLKAELQKKYKAVFIDEFQDTDQLQYEIFDTLFGKSSILFYIGDPKQAIYSFRGADIDTYKKAAASTNEAFTMDKNFRSTPNLIQAMNSFFSLIENPFLDDKIKYEIVSNGKPTKELQLDGKAEKPLAYMTCSNKDEIAKQLALHILNLLQNNYTIEERKIIPSDIGVLVRSKNDGIKIKKALNKLGIPSVTIDDAKVLESSEAHSIFYLLKASLEPSRANINRALLSSLTSIDKQTLLSGDLETDIIHFKNIETEWRQNSVLGAISLFIKLYQVKSNLLGEHDKNGERILTNIFQIMELLHRKELENKLLPEELLNQFHNIIEGEDTQGDEYTQRIESDDDAVKIVTIHKSKGLSYNIVFAPFLDLQSKAKKEYTFLEYKNDTKASCFSMYKTEEEIGLYEFQNEQENRRLLYVALTRAVYKNYIFHNTYHTGGRGTIMQFIKALNPSPYFEALKELPATDEKLPQVEIKEKKPAEIFKRTLARNWSVLSYSRLSDAHISFSAQEKDNWESPYDEFVFAKLPKGPVAGNFLHDLFENSDFTSDSFHKTITDISKKYSAIFDETELDNYNKLIEQVLNANYAPEGFKLSELTNSQKLPELEFYFNLSNFSTSKIQKISDLIDIESSKITQGMMYGFIDLFFEYKGKYYILDWKSNFLGNTQEDYSSDQLSLAMRGNNYHLQYLIYTIAVKRFLSLKLPNFSYEKHFGGVLYVFLRGCRENQSQSIFYTKPKEELIEALDLLF